MRAVSLLSLFASFSPLVAGQFVSPPAAGKSFDFSQNPVWSIGDTKTIAWNTDYDSFFLAFFQLQVTSQGNGATHYDSSITQPGDSSQSLSWIVSHDSSKTPLSQGNIFYFHVYNASNPNNTQFIESHYINITDPSTSTTTTTATPTKSPSASSTLIVSAVTTTAPNGAVATYQVTVPPGSASTTTPAVSSDNGGSGGLSDGAKAGIGVGVGIGVALILAGLAAFFFIRRRRNRQATGAYEPNSTSYQPWATGAAAGASPNYEAKATGGHQPSQAEGYYGYNENGQKPAGVGGPQEVAGTMRHEVEGTPRLGPTHEVRHELGS